MHTEVTALLMDIEGELRTLGLWSNDVPAPEALNSDQPFCVDTLTLSQWLQFVFLPTLYQLMQANQVLPRRCGVAPMAEEYFRGAGLATDALIDALAKIDSVLSSACPEENPGC